MKELVLSFIWRGGGGRKPESENKEFNNKIEATCIYKSPPLPTRHRSKIFMILFFFLLIFFLVDFKDYSPHFQKQCFVPEIHVLYLLLE